MRSLIELSWINRKGYINDQGEPVWSKNDLRDFLEEKMKKTYLGPWPGDKDPSRDFDVHRGLLCFRYLSENSQKSESALKSGLSRFK